MPEPLKWIYLNLFANKYNIDSVWFYSDFIRTTLIRLISVYVPFLYPSPICFKAAQLRSRFPHRLIIPRLSWVLLSRADCSCWKSRRQLNISDCSGCDRILWASKQVREKAFRKNVSLCQDVSSLLAFHTWKMSALMNMKQHTCHTHTHTHTHTE